MRAALGMVAGTYGLAVMDAAGRRRSWSRATAARWCSASATSEMFVASDAAALVRHTRNVVYLDDGEMAVVRADGYVTATLDGGPDAKTPTTIAWTGRSLRKGAFTHFMRKEIPEQPEAVRAHAARPPRTALSDDAARRHGPRRARVARDPPHQDPGLRLRVYRGFPRRAHDRAAGAASGDAEPAAEFRYRNPVIEHDTLYIAVSQSGETFDTWRRCRRSSARAGGARHRQRRRQHDRARVRARHLPACRSRDRRGVDEDVHLHAVAFVLLALHLGRMRDLSAAAGRPVDRCARRTAGAASRSIWRARPTSPRWRKSCHAARTHISSAARRLRPRDGRGVEAEGGQLPARRSVSRIGAEARPAGVDLAGNAHCRGDSVG